ncbi:hypothetical protein [Mesorhizobium amorphae]|nr:hypothetical protein [Mesorhizobium amorphae]
MARHGVVNVGSSVREVVFRAFYLEQEAKRSRPDSRSARSST